MQLPDIKQLKELLKLLRAQGVLQYQSTDLNLVLSETLPQSSKRQPTTTEELQLEQDEDPALEIERMIDYSSRNPSEDV